MVGKGLNLGLELEVLFMQVCPLETKGLGILSQSVDVVFSGANLGIKFSNSGSQISVMVVFTLESAFKVSIFASQTGINGSLVVQFTLHRDLLSLQARQFTLSFKECDLFSLEILGANFKETSAIFLPGLLFL